MRAGYLILVAFLWMGLGCKKNTELKDIEVLPGSWSLSRYQVTNYKNGSQANDNSRTDIKNIAQFSDNGSGRMSIPELPNLRTDSIRYILSDRVLSMTFINSTAVTFYIKALNTNTLTLETRSPVTTDADANQVQTITNYFYIR